MSPFRVWLRKHNGAVEAFEVLEARLRPDFRRALMGFALAAAALVAGTELGGLHAPRLRERLIVIGLAVAFVIFGVIATRSAANQVSKAAGRASLGAGAAAKVLCQLVGYLVVFFGVMGLLTIPLQQLLLGGALTGVIVGIAAQQPLSNLFAGLVLLMARPVTVGQRIRIYSGALGGPLDGLVIELGLIYATLSTDDGGVLRIPNTALLNSAIGAAPLPPPPAAADPEETPPASG
ncbi:MAG TPA: mechanosensitive ion channel family protein [Pseudonocardia sp.]|nr:mechanosensitive ion channel family protein [Pseudonocardia sp.]